MANTMDKLNEADKALTNLEDPPPSEAFRSSIDAARASISAARSFQQEYQKQQGQTTR